MPDPAFASAFDGAAAVYAGHFEKLQSIAQPVEARPFPLGVWQHFPNRRKWYRTSDQFYVLQGDPEAMLAAIAAVEAGRYHVIDLIGLDPAGDAAIYQDAGYELDSVEVLMDRVVTDDDAAQSDDPRAVSELSDTQIAALADVWNNGRDANGYQPILPAHNSAPGLVQRYIEIDGQPAAYGRAIVDNGSAFLSDVNTFPAFRRQGLGRAIMEALHGGIARAGATRVVLTSTEMGLSLYQQLGYRDVAQDWILTSPAE